MYFLFHYKENSKYIILQHYEQMDLHLFFFFQSRNKSENDTEVLLFWNVSLFWLHSQNMVLEWPWLSYSCVVGGDFERKGLRRILCGEITVSENRRKRYNEELMRLLVYLDIISLVELSSLYWIGHLNRTDSEREGSQIFNNNPQRSPLRRRPKNR